jgi:hypothetical protein
MCIRDRSLELWAWVTRQLQAGRSVHFEPPQAAHPELGVRARLVPHEFEGPSAAPARPIVSYGQGAAEAAFSLRGSVTTGREG